MTNSILNPSEKGALRHRNQHDNHASPKSLSYTEPGQRKSLSD